MYTQKECKWDRREPVDAKKGFPNQMRSQVRQWGPDRLDPCTWGPSRNKKERMLNTDTNMPSHTHTHTLIPSLSLTHTHLYSLLHMQSHTHTPSQTHTSQPLTPQAHLTLQLHKWAAHPPCPALTTLFRLPGMLSPMATPPTPLCLVLQLSAPACLMPTSTSLPELLPHTVLPSGCGEARLGTAGHPDPCRHPSGPLSTKPQAQGTLQPADPKAP